MSLIDIAVETGVRLDTLREVHALAVQKQSRYGSLGAAALSSFIRDLQMMIQKAEQAGS